MIGASIGIVAVAALFVAAGLLRVRTGHGSGLGCRGGQCDSCPNDCEFDKEGRLP